MNSRVAGTLPGQTKTTLFFNLGNVGMWVLPSQAARAGCAFSSRRLGLRGQALQQDGGSGRSAPCQTVAPHPDSFKMKASRRPRFATFNPP